MYRRVNNPALDPRTQLDDPTQELRLVLGYMRKEWRSDGTYAWSMFHEIHNHMITSIRQTIRLYANQHHRPGVREDVARLSTIGTRLQSLLDELVAKGLIEYRHPD